MEHGWWLKPLGQVQMLVTIFCLAIDVVISGGRMIHVCKPTDDMVAHM